ncbi:MAG: putative RNA-binding protein associated with RNAse of E/G family [Flavobacterium sp.]|jgi:predicted RNA-binding protein associated with RNAse of E/G family
MIKFYRKIRQNLLSEGKIVKYFKYAIGEIVLVVIGILIALSINNWNNTKISSKVEQNILEEIANGLNEDLPDVKHNIEGHKKGIKACIYWRKIINNEQVETDSVALNYWNLTRNFVASQNISSYESLKSRGLELITNDSLRLQIISLYETDYNILKTLEEDYDEFQFHKNYFKDINHFVSPHLVFNKEGDIQTIQIPLHLSEEEKKEFLSYLWKIEKNRNVALNYYSDLEKKIIQSKKNIDKKIAKD